MKKHVPCPVCDGKGFTTWVNTTETSCGTCSKTCQHCNGTGLREIPMSNADRIRAMTDEELATFIYTATRACNNYECESCPIGDENCPELDKWLKQPHTESEGRV